MLLHSFTPPLPKNALHCCLGQTTLDKGAAHSRQAAVLHFGWVTSKETFELCRAQCVAGISAGDAGSTRSRGRSSGNSTLYSTSMVIQKCDGHTGATSVIVAPVFTRCRRTRGIMMKGG